LKKIVRDQCGCPNLSAAHSASPLRCRLAALNSTATLVAYDLFKRYQPSLNVTNCSNWQNHHRRGTILAIIVFAFVWSLYDDIEGINKLIIYVSPPVTTVFCSAFSGNGLPVNLRFITLDYGIIPGFVTFYLDWNNIYRGDFMLISVSAVVACVVVMV